MVLPLVYFPTDIVLLDDDELFLHAISQELKYQLISNVMSTIYADEICTMLNECVSLTKMFAVQQINGWGLGNYSQTFEIESLQSLMNLRDHKRVISSIVVDYKMHGGDVMPLLSKIQDTNVYKILLTGIAGEELAINCLNDGMIDFYFRKSDPMMIEKLSSQLRINEMNYFINGGHHITNMICESEPESLLHNAKYCEIVTKFINENNIKEYYLIDGIGSYAMFDCDGTKYLFYITYRAAILAQVELIRERALNIQESLLQEIIDGEKIICSNQDFQNLETLQSYLKNAQTIILNGVEYHYYHGLL